MSDISIFTDKAVKPDEAVLKEKLGDIYRLWQEISDYVMEKYPGGLAEWNFPGKKYGWSFRIKDKKRAIIYLLPREQYFKAALVFGQKAYDDIMQSSVSQEIKNDLAQAKKYVEGRGIRIDVTNDSVLPDIKQLIDIKLAH